MKRTGCRNRRSLLKLADQRADKRKWNAMMDSIMLAREAKDLTPVKISGLLTELSNFPLPQPSIRSEDIGLVAICLVEISLQNSDMLWPEISRILNSWASATAMIYNLTIAEPVIDKLLLRLDQGPTWYSHDVLRCLSTILASCSSRLPLAYDGPIIDTICKGYLRPSDLDERQTNASLTCLQSLLDGRRGKISSALQKTCMKQLSSLLFHKILALEKTAQLHTLETLLSTFKLLEIVLLGKHAAMIDHDEQKFLSDVFRLIPRVLDQEATDSVAQYLHIRDRLVNVKIHALLVAQKLGKVYPGAIQMNWMTWYPYKGRTSEALETSCCLYLEILGSESAKLRIAAAATYIVILEHARLSMIMGKQIPDRLFTKSYTSVSWRAFELLATGFHVVSRALEAENHLGVVVQIVKCFGALIRESSPAVLSSSDISPIFSNIFNRLHVMLRSNDQGLQLTILTCLASIIEKPQSAESFIRQTSTEKRPDESVTQNVATTVFVDHYGGPDVVLQILPQAYSFKESIFECVMSFAQAGNTALRFEALSLVAKALRTVPTLASQYFVRINTIVREAFNDFSPDIRLQGLRLLRASLEINSSAAFTDMLSMAIQMCHRAFSDTDPNIRAAACLVFSSNSREALLQLEGESFDQVYEDILRCTRDKATSVRAAAVRILGSLFSFPHFQNSGYFVRIASRLLESLQDMDNSTRTWASWSLSHLISVSHTNQVLDLICGDVDTHPILSRMTTSFLNRLNHGQQVCINCIRTLGFAGFWHSALEVSHISLQDVVEVIIHHLNNAEDSKVRWNACVALGRMLEWVSEKDMVFPWIVDVVDALCTAMHNRGNFKVLIRASAAISALATRESYGCSFHQAIFSLVDCYNYDYEPADQQLVKALQTQCGESMAHLIGLASRADLDVLAPLLNSPRLIGVIER